MDEPFGRVRSIITRLANVLKCQKCLLLKEEDSMAFFHFCDHFYCQDCLRNQISCLKCKNPLDKPIKVTDDKSILSLYQSFMKFELPSREKIKSIYKNFKESKKLHGENVGELTKPNEKKLSNSKSNHSKDNNEETHSTFTESEEKVTPEDIYDKNSQCCTGEKENSSQKKNTSFATDIDCESANKKKRSNANTPKFSKSSKRKTLVDVGPVQIDNSTTTTTTTIITTPSSSSKTLASKINVNKRNPKGETQLHIACKKSNFNLMKELIDAGANLNAKDNAGWTPLHDSVFSGNIEVVKFLLDNGAKINIPGLENTTALHEAIAKENSKLVRLLLDYGADIHAKNIFRETPLDLVTKYNFTELKEILLEAAKSKKNESGLGQEESEDLLESKTLYKHNLNVEDEKLVNKFAEKFKFDLVSCMTKKSVPTHIIVPKKKFEITWRLISFVPYGCWIVTIDWVKESLEEITPKPPGAYTLSENLTEGFTKARNNRLKELPDLFSGCHFFFGGNFEFYEVKNMTIEKETLKSLVERNGGVILKRCPDPESLALEKTIPYHANSLGSLRETSYFIIYQREKWDPKPKYNMSHMKTLSVEWLAACIYKFELIDPKDFEGLDF